MLKPSIYYFSATGNSLYAAKKIGEVLSADIIKVNNNTVPETASTVIGIVYPIYCFGVPDMVEKFIQQLEIKSENPYIFSIATFANSSGNAHGQINELLSQKGFHLSYSADIPMLGNHIGLYDIDNKRMKDKLSNADELITAASKTIKRKGVHEVKNWPLYAKVFYRYYDKKHETADNLFWVTGSCTGCGICTKVCPAENIEIQCKKPVFQHHCQNCFACIHWCPYKALQWGKKTADRNRYHHPSISLKEIANQ